jgi:hypothetical protein
VVSSACVIVIFLLSGLGLKTDDLAQVREKDAVRKLGATPLEDERRRVGPEAGPTSASCIAVFPQECMGQLASFGPT